MTLKTVDALVDAELIAADQADAIGRVVDRYAVAIPPALADLIKQDPASDPIARQFVPDRREVEMRPEERHDPIGDEAHSPVAGIVHRYTDRVLLKIVSTCPVYCRFCFRRETVGPGGTGMLSKAEIDEAVSYIRHHREVGEVILTGGDPLILSPRRVRFVTEKLAAIPHVKILRWHSRVPVAVPERVTDDLIAALTVSAASVVIAVHANHPREFTPGMRAACARLQKNGVRLISQSVLLRFVNNDVETLESLMHAFVETGIKPYYLHHLDLAPGTSHFRVSIREGQALMRALRQRYSGAALPTYMLDIPGGAGKVPLTREYATYLGSNSDGATYRIRDSHGRSHIYHDIV